MCRHVRQCFGQQQLHSFLVGRCQIGVAHLFVQFFHVFVRVQTISGPLARGSFRHSFDVGFLFGGWPQPRSARVSSRQLFLLQSALWVGGHRSLQSMGLCKRRTVGPQTSSALPQQFLLTDRQQRQTSFFRTDALPSNFFARQRLLVLVFLKTIVPVGLQLSPVAFLTF